MLTLQLQCDSVQLPVFAACWHHLHTALLTPAEGWRAKRQENQVTDWFDWFWFFFIGMQGGTNSRRAKEIYWLAEKHTVLNFILILFWVLHISLCIYKHNPSIQSLFLTLATTFFFSSGKPYPSHIRMFSSTSCKYFLPSIDYHL